MQTIRKTKVPIICICNDKYGQKLRSLRNHCLELDFRKPTVQQISKRMLEVSEEGNVPSSSRGLSRLRCTPACPPARMQIARAEGLEVDRAAMDALVQTANGGDVRLILGQLQMIRLRSRSLAYDEAKQGGAGTAKDLEIGPFEAARRLLEAEGASLRCVRACLLDVSAG